MRAPVRTGLGSFLHDLELGKLKTHMKMTLESLVARLYTPGQVPRGGSPGGLISPPGTFTVDDLTVQILVAHIHKKSTPRSTPINMLRAADQCIAYAVVLHVY